MPARLNHCLTGLLILLCATTAHAQKWGTLKGRFVVDGTPAERPALDINNAPLFLQKNPPDETVVIAKDGALVNVVVYLHIRLGEKIEVAPAYQAKLKVPAVLEHKDCALRPHIVTVCVGQQLNITNSDPVAHNTNISLLGSNRLLQPNQNIQIAVTKDGPIPMPIHCNAHRWTQGYILSLTHPYVAVSGQDGSFDIKDIPPGMHEFEFWHESPGYLKHVNFTGGETDARGQARIQIDADHTTDLGDIKIDAAILR